MKRLIHNIALCLLSMFIFVTALPADELLIGSVPYLDIESETEDNFNIKYDTEANLYYIQTYDWLNTAWVILSPEQFESLRKTIDKTLDWCQIAFDNNTAIQKELPNSNIQSDVIWEFGDDIYFNSPYEKVSLSFDFFSTENRNNQIMSSLVIMAPRVTSTTNDYVEYKFPQMLIPEEYIQIFKYTITEDAINDAIEKNEKTKAAESLFN